MKPETNIEENQAVSPESIPLGVASCSPSSDTPETDKAWECDHPLWRLSDSEKRELCASMERARNAKDMQLYSARYILEDAEPELLADACGLPPEVITAALRVIFPENDPSASARPTKTLRL